MGQVPPSAFLSRRMQNCGVGPSQRPQPLARTASPARYQVTSDFAVWVLSDHERLRDRFVNMRRQSVSLSAGSCRGLRCHHVWRNQYSITTAEASVHGLNKFACSLCSDDPEGDARGRFGCPIALQEWANVTLLLFRQSILHGGENTAWGDMASPAWARSEPILGALARVLPDR